MVGNEISEFVIFLGALLTDASYLLETAARFTAGSSTSFEVAEKALQDSLHDSCARAPTFGGLHCCGIV